MRGVADAIITWYIDYSFIFVISLDLIASNHMGEKVVDQNN
jgi:hypothetical protein